MKYAGSIGGILAAIVAWQTLGWPRPALNIEVEVVDHKADGAVRYGKGTRSLLLRSDRRYMERQLDKLNQRKVKEPNNTDLDQMIRNKREDIQDIQEKIRDLK